jgi:peptide/nickel transport system substrate-binding protein
MRRIILTTVISAAMTITAHAQAPRKGGTLRMTAPYGTSFSSLDMHTTPRAQDDIYGKTVHRTLYNWNSEKNQVELELASSVDVSADRKTYTYKLREAYFHNGKRLTADDIIYSYTRLMDGKKAFAGARWARLIEGAVAVEKGEAQTISGLKKIDDYTLEMKITDKVDPGYYLYNGSAAIYPAGEADKPEFLQKPIGLGPFKFIEHVPGSRLVAERWEKFYKPVYLDKVIIAVMGEAPARDIAFRNKEVDLSILGPVQYVAYKEDAALKGNILEVAEVFTRHLGMSPEFKPFADKRVRQAVNHAIDTDLIIKRLVKAYRAISWLPIGALGHDKDRKPYAFDPEKAKKLLEEAGYKDGFEFELSTSQNESWGLPIVEAMIPMLARVGIKVKVKQMEVSVLVDAMRKPDYQAYIISSQTGPDPLAALKCFHSSTPSSACGQHRMRNAEVDKLLDEAAQTTDQAKLGELLKKIDGIVYEEAPIWFFNYNKAVMAYQPWVKGLQANATELTHQYPEYIWVTEQSPAK